MSLLVELASDVCLDSRRCVARVPPRVSFPHSVTRDRQNDFFSGLGPDNIILLFPVDPGSTKNIFIDFNSHLVDAVSLSV